MNVPAQIAKHFREVYFGGNWTSVDLKNTLCDVDWQQAVTKIDLLNTIAALVFHINYYVSAVLKVLQGGSLEAHDNYSFDVAPIRSQADWEELLKNTWSNAEEFAALVEQLPEGKLQENFCEEKYGSYYLNLHGIIEHCHYHLGQIVLIKKLIVQA